MARTKAVQVPSALVTRPDGSRWSYTPADIGPRPRGGKAATEWDERRERIEAVTRKLAAMRPTPRKPPKPARPMSMAEYAKRVARPLPPVGPVCFCGLKRCRCGTIERLPDDDGEGAPAARAARLAAAEAAYAAALATEMRGLDRIDSKATPSQLEAAWQRAERTNAALAHLQGVRGEAE